jgi:hypothetical protein
MPVNDAYIVTSDCDMLNPKSQLLLREFGSTRT